nr:ABC transporter substrate-binding protein [uncultured Rhodopila sp.]
MTGSKPAPSHATHLSSERLLRSSRRAALLTRVVLSFALMRGFVITEASAADDVTLGLNWLPQADFGGFYQALADGTYERYGIKLTIHPGGPQINSAQMLASGAYDFARIPTGLTMFNMVDKGLPYVAVAAIYQHDPQVLISHASQNIHSPRDMAGHPILMTAESTTTWWPVLKQEFGLTDTQIRPYTYGSATFIANETAITQGYYTNDLPHLQALGYKVDYLLLSQWGYDPYASLIVTSGTLIRNRPDLVKRFLTASTRGWMTYLHGDHTAADQLMAKSNPNFSPESARMAIEAINKIDLVQGGDAATSGIGIMTDNRWKNFYDTMLKSHSVTPGLNWRSAFTTQFVNAQVETQ